MTDRQDIAGLAREWIGTPYHHQASAKGIGCDCLGLLRGVWREAVGPEPGNIPNYSPGWDEVSRREDMLNLCREHLIETSPAERSIGGVLVFRMKREFVAKHCGIIVAADPLTWARFIHCHNGRGTVEIELSDWWIRKIASGFVFPSANLRKVGG